MSDVADEPAGTSGRSAPPRHLPSTAEMVAMLDTGPFASFAIDWDGTVTYVSQNISEVIGFRADELVGTDVFDLLHPDEADRARGAVDAMRVIHLRTRGMVYHLRTSAGTYEPCLVAAEPHEVDGRSFCQVVVMATPMRLAVGEALQAVVRGGSLAESLGEIERVVNRTLAGALFGFVFADPAGGLGLLGSVPPSLAGLRPDGSLDTRPETPWMEAISSGQTTSVERADLPADLARAAESHGQHTVIVVPVPDARSGQPTLIIGWVPLPHVTTVMERALEDVVSPVVELVLDRQHHLAQVQWAADHDALTGLCNRSSFYRQLHRALEGDQDRAAVPLAVLYLDLDGFKAINDDHGHAFGDEVLRTVARRITQELPTEAFCGRLGGDEFAVALPGTTAVGATEVARALLAAVSAPFDIELPPDSSGAQPGLVSVGVSVGIATSEAASHPDDLVDIADAALLSAKRSGKGVWRVAGPAGGSAGGPAGGSAGGHGATDELAGSAGGEHPV